MLSLVKVVEINFLCVHRKLREKRLAPLLIKEVTRRVHLKGIFQAVYTAGILLPRPVTSPRYYHRSIQIKKLVEIGFASIPRDATMADMVKEVKLPAVSFQDSFRNPFYQDFRR
jgi:glycylpeptide N-tetradecanoyltransferase